MPDHNRTKARCIIYRKDMNKKDFILCHKIFKEALLPKQ